MAAALLARRLRVAGAPLVVRSAGVVGHVGEAPPAEVITVLASYGIDAGGHRSRAVSAADLDSASLVLAMAREHVRYAAVTVPDSWPRAFTLREMVRRAGKTGPREPGEPLAGWLARLHAGRDRHGLLGDDSRDDMADPMGGPLAAYAATATEIGHLVSRLAALGWGVPAPA